MTPTAARIGHGVVAAAAIAGLAVDLVLVVTGATVLQPEDDPGVVGRLVRFVSYFTVQSNLLVAAVSLSTVRDPARDGRVWRVLRLDALMGIVVTGVVHWFLLRPLLDLHGAAALGDALLHVVSPVLAVVAWLVFGPRPRVGGRTVLQGLIWPLLWVGWTLTAGAVTGWYPYPFLDVGVLGVARVAVAIAGIAVLMALVELIVWALDRVLPGQAREFVSSTR